MRYGAMIGEAFMGFRRIWLGMLLARLYLGLKPYPLTADRFQLLTKKTDETLADDLMVDLVLRTDL